MKSVDLLPGDRIPDLVKDPISKVQLLKYAGASGDYNLIHTDVESAKSAGLGDVIAHGMLSMGFLGHFVSGISGAESVRRLKVKFAAMVRLGDVLTCKGVVTKVSPLEEGSRFIVLLDVWVENQKAEKVTVGKAEVYLTAAE